MNNAGYAFPQDEGAVTDRGLTLRDYFAAQALTGIQQWDAILNGKHAKFQHSDAFEQMAKTAYGIADAMLAERVK